MAPFDYRELKNLEVEMPGYTKKASAQVTVTEEELPLHTRGYSLSRLNTSRDDWKTGVRERMPWWGFSALVIAMLCSGGSVLVLHFSDDKSAAQWPDLIAPNVCLSILGSVSTIAITYAIGEGVAVAWWRAALRGASVKELHNAWAFSASVTTIFTQFKYFNAIALASLMAKVSIIDSVLFQRATHTYIGISWEPKAAEIQSWSQDYFPVTGIAGFNNETEFLPSSSFGEAVSNWVLTGRAEFDFERFSIQGCHGVGCEFWQLGPGFAFDCETSVSNDTFLETAPETPDSAEFELFSVALSMHYPDEAKDYSRLGLNIRQPAVNYELATLFSDDPLMSPCPVSFNILQCELRPAVLNYSTWFLQSENIEESRVAEVLKAEATYSHGDQSNRATRYAVSAGSSGTRLGTFCGSIPANMAGIVEASSEVGRCFEFDIPSRQNLGVEVVENKDIYEPWTPGANATLLGIYETLRNRLQTRTVTSFQDDEWHAKSSGSLAYYAIADIPTDGSCAYAFGYDGLGSIAFQVVEEINMLTRQIGVNPRLYTNDLMPAPNQKAPGKQYFRDVYYTTVWVYAIAAIACTLLVVICVLPAYYGFWQLGRDVTLGPMEIAYAFQGPAFAGVHDTNGHVDTLVKAAGNQRVRYTAIEDETGTKLGFKMG